MSDQEPQATVGAPRPLTCLRADTKLGSDFVCAATFGEQESDHSAVPEACARAQEIGLHAAAYDASMIQAGVCFCAFQEMQLQV